MNFKKSASHSRTLFNELETSMSHDPLEAIYALNIGDFVTDSFISDELLNKISKRLANEPGKLKAQLEELIQIYSMDKTLGLLGYESTEGFVIYDSVCDTLANMFQVDACHLFQLANKGGGENFISLSGTSATVENGHRWEIGVMLKANHWLSDFFRLGELQMVEDIAKLPNWKPLTGLGQEKAQSVLVAPLYEGGRSLGVLVLERHQKAAFAPELSDLAGITTKMFTTGMRLQQLVGQAQGLVLEENPAASTLQNCRAQITESIADLGIHQQAFAEALAGAVDARQDFTQGHSKAVAHIAKTLAEQLALNEKTVDLVYYAGLLGSLGKLHIPNEVLSKAGKLTAEEAESLRNHPNVGVSMLGKMNFLSETTPYVQSQRERWDGSGSPEKLSGRSIPLGARILAIADAYFAMTHPRPYRNTAPMNSADAIKQLQSESGSLWDPMLIEAFSTIPASALEPI